jgi:hypothetical protein
MTKERPKCPNCGIEMKGCGCLFTTASDGKRVHKTCKEQYEAKLKKKELNNNNTKTCAYCERPFTETPYFKGMDGRDVHYACLLNYDRSLMNQNKK